MRATSRTVMLPSLPRNDATAAAIVSGRYATTESEEVARANAEMTRVAGVVRGQADSLLAALASPGAGQAEIRRRAQRIFHLERRVLQLHQAVEAVIGVKPPADPPALEPDTTGHR